MKLQLTITAEYDLSEYPPEQLASARTELVERMNQAAEDTNLTGEGYATLNACNHVVHDGDELARLADERAELIAALDTALDSIPLLEMPENRCWMVPARELLNRLTP